MNHAASASNDPSIRIQWMWGSNPNAFAKSQAPEWSYYSDVENSIIEEAFLAKQSHALLDDYYIDFKHYLQISKNDLDKQRPVKRVKSNRDDIRLREERFISNPIAPERPFGGLYGWVSPFIQEVKVHLKLDKKQLPSLDETIVPMIVEQAALGIIEEGKKLGKNCEGEWLAKQLMERKHSGMKEVWKCCAYLYSKDSFLCKKVNEAMRLIGSEEHELVWRSKVHTFGPFCLLLWDNPFNDRPTTNPQTVYRGVNLSPAEINCFKNHCFQDPKPQGSFQAFTSCTRNRDAAECFGNVLLIMKMKYVFRVDLAPFSQFSDEEEELLFPAVSFTVERVEFNENMNKHMIYLNMQHKFNKYDKSKLSAATSSPGPNHILAGLHNIAAAHGFGGVRSDLSLSDLRDLVDDVANEAPGAGNDFLIEKHGRDLLNDYYDRNGDGHKN